MFPLFVVELFVIFVFSVYWSHLMRCIDAHTLHSSMYTLHSVELPSSLGYFCSCRIFGFCCWYFLLFLSMLLLLLVVVVGYCLLLLLLLLFSSCCAAFPNTTDQDLYLYSTLAVRATIKLIGWCVRARARVCVGMAWDLKCLTSILRLPCTNSYKLYTVQI